MTLFNMSLWLHNCGGRLKMAQACAKPKRAKQQKTSWKAVHFRLHLPKQVWATNVRAPLLTKKRRGEKLAIISPF